MIIIVLIISSTNHPYFSISFSREPTPIIRICYHHDGLTTLLAIHKSPLSEGSGDQDGHVVRRSGYIQYHIHLRQLQLLTLDENGNKNVFLVVNDFNMADYLQSHMYE